ncbi:hypothetical protein H6758_00535 [Candidatus Nomurabacteria bacterium]|nr:hypothetical protein [Candidatus Nomurabacteria bacterium]
MDEVFCINVPVIARNEFDLVFYEVKQLNCCVPLITDEEQLRRMKLEAFLVHARNLIDFFEAKSKKNDSDLFAFDFCGINGLKINSICTSIPDTIKKKINKHLQHITKDRLSEKVAWNVGLILNSINKSYSIFLSAIHDKYFSDTKREEHDCFKYITDKIIPS